MELWDLYTKDRELTGKTHVRGEPLPLNFFHLVIHVWIRNSKGQYLISQRAANRPSFPLLWECVGGSVLQGETSLQGAVREVKEEVGIDLPPSAGSLLFSHTRTVVDGKRYQDILDVWRFPYDGPCDLSLATTDEVAQSRWLFPEEIQKLYDDHLLVDTLEYFFQKVAPVE